MRKVRLPQQSFADLAVEMALIAGREAGGANVMEIWLARMDSPEPVIVRAMEEVRRNADLAAGVHDLLMALIPHEAQIRALLAGSTRPSLTRRIVATFYKEMARRSAAG